MVNQMLSQLRRHLVETDAHYSHWVVFGGVNDLYSDQTAHRTLGKIERDLDAIYTLAHQRNGLVVALTVAPWGGFRRWYTAERGVNTAALNRWIVEQHAAGRVDFVVDSGASLTCGDSTSLCPRLTDPFRDGLHFGPQGHQRLGNALLAVVGEAACNGPAK